MIGVTSRLRLAGAAVGLVVLALGAPKALAATPPAGIAQDIRRGLYVSTDVGFFFVPGGAQPNGYSDGQAYVQLEVGYDILKQLSINFSFALGAVANACFDKFNGSAAQPCGPNGAASDNFTISYYQLAITYNVVRLFERLDVGVKAMVGYAVAAPAPLETVNLATQIGGFAPGVGVGIEYATNLDHFAIGLDVAARLAISPLPPIFTLAIFPRIKYTF
jgi:hypothetical protein